SATGAVRAPLLGGRWHFQHGPIDIVLEAWGDADECTRAYEQAWARFQTVLPELVRELPTLRKRVVRAKAVSHARAGACARERASSRSETGPVFREDDKIIDAFDNQCPLTGAVAQRMWRACAPFAAVFITPMAAVAGAVADEVIAAMLAGRALRKAYVNNG